MKKFAALMLSLLLSTGAAFADSPKDSPKGTDAQPAKAAPAAKSTTTKSNAEIAAEMEELRQALQAQQEQLQMLKEELARRDRQIEEAREAAASANSRATEATTKANEAVATSAEVKTTTSALNTSVANVAAASPKVSGSSAVPSGQGAAEEKGPTTIRFKGVNITPGGFIEAATVTRQRALSADINTPFNSIPFTANSLGHLTETNFTARQSRLTLLVDAKIGETKVSGYYEADFLGAGTTSNNRESNSYVFRQRQLWGRADFADGWAFSAGQMWSLSTQNRKGLANRTEWFPLMIDPQYLVGFTWQRANAFRVAKSFGDKFALAASVEGSQETLGGRGFSTYTAANGTVTQNAWVFAPGSGGGLYNAFDPTGYSVNKTPDFIVKASFDPGFGHYEVYGILSTFQNRIYPCAVVSITAANAAALTNVNITDANGNVYTGSYNANKFASGSNPLASSCTNTTPSATGAYNSSTTGGGVGFHAFAPIKKFDVGLSGAYGDGTGRFYSAQLADTTMRPDGSITMIHNASWLGSLEWHVHPKWDVYGYVGGEYAGRAAYVGYQAVSGTSATVPVTLSLTTLGGGTPPASLLYPETQTSWKVTTNGVGGYGSPYANNTGCSTENAPGGTSAPSGGGTCAGDTRYISEATIGFWNKLYQGEKGRVQWGIQYSYFYRNTWSGSNGLTGTTSVSPHAVDNMVWTSFRYYIP